MGLTSIKLPYQSSKNRLFGVPPRRMSSASFQPIPTFNVNDPFNNDYHRAPNRRNVNARRNAVPINMLVSQRGISNSRLAVILVGVVALIAGLILSSVPWVHYIVLKNLKLWNGTLSYHYWQKPGVLRLTKVFIFNVTNPDGFLHNGEKPKLQEVGPFVYREDMEKVNIKFHNNGTVTYQHKKILEFMPHLSVIANDEVKLTVPNIPLLTLTTQANSLPSLLRSSLSAILRFSSLTPFKHVTPQQLVFGYDDPLTSLANTYYPKGKRPPKQMGLFLLRNGTLNEVSTIYTGHTGMDKFGLLDRINGMDELPFWKGSPCNSIRASEGSFFPPREITKSDIVHIYDKDLCRVWALRYRKDIVKDGVTAGYYTPDDNLLETSAVNPDNKCFCEDSTDCTIKGLQYIGPCQFNAPVYLSFPHFYNADPKLLEDVEGLQPDQEKHETFMKIQQRLGVPLEARVKVQLNLKVEQSNIYPTSNFRSIVFPIMWLEEGVGDLPENIQRWIYLATTFVDTAVPLFTYGLILGGTLILVTVFVRTYHQIVFNRENIERGTQRILRRGSSILINGQQRLLIVRDSYHRLSQGIQETDVDAQQLLSPE
ncbi:scavenger receptor class B member 1 [Daktulosphaira vitifoliae]|uniref:scavenger receptor class B member 1 n=1 Tax=Daktulosphaira vitifoliae TaxID=58002 RepID=UPI0021AA3264|nr:scavenger receptor class B member 1 [Daktulosphaira vitifoliae]XP_050524926.1 scavenger receptor class B member 1 [Daktulosphaira vitifoliae]XP_050524927.1 scavenger receptor class B member 1 [Daktulosphaira vitifoliae]